MNAETIFAEALKQEKPDERARFLDEACGEDAALRAEVDELLGAHESAEGFLDLDGAYAPTLKPPAVSERSGDVIGPYKLLQQIGEGGFGVVYMAEQTEPVRRKVALKIIKPGMDTKEVVARFEAERQALALMDHPNIARVLDGGTTETGRPYFVMELVKGVPITQFCDENQLDTRRRLELFRLVCKAIQHAHQKGVIHRDIKPSNVMVTLHDGEPVPRIIDFGVAKAISQQLTERTMFTAYGQMIGTPQYMSPEQAEMSGLDIDTRSDVYSLGVLLYELLTGCTPLDPKQLRQTAFHEMQRMIREEEPPRPSVRLTTLGEQTASIAASRSTDPRNLGDVVRGDLDWIAMKALEKNRERRYDSAKALAGDIERFLNHEPVEACPPSAGYRLRKYARRNRQALLVVGTINALLFIGTFVSTFFAIQMLNERDRANAGEAEVRELLDRETELREQAEDKAAAAATTLGFVNDHVFAAANPWLQPDREKPLVEILREIPTDTEELPDQSPEAEAAIRHYLGVTCRILSLHAESQVHLERALELRMQGYGADYAETARTQYELANVLLVRGLRHGGLAETEALLERADQLSTQSHETLHARLGPDDPDTLSATMVLVQVCHFRGDQPRALAIFRAAEDELANWSDYSLSDAPAFPPQSLEMIVRREEAGLNGEIDRVISENYTAACRELPETHPHRLFWTTWRACALIRQGRLPQADPLLTEATETRLRLLGRDSQFTWLGARALANLRVRQQDRDDAIRWLDVCCGYRPTDKSTVLSRGVLLLDRGTPEDRGNWLDNARTLLDAHGETDHPETAYQTALLALAVPPHSDAESAMQQKGIALARRAGTWADREPPGVLLFPDLMRPSLLLVHAIAEYRADNFTLSRTLLEQVQSERSAMCRAIALAYEAIIESGQGGDGDRVRELIAEAQWIAAGAPPEDVDDTGSHLWNRRILLELAIREATEADSTRADESADDGNDAGPS